MRFDGDLISDGPERPRSGLSMFCWELWSASDDKKYEVRIDPAEWYSCNRIRGNVLEQTRRRDKKEMIAFFVKVAVYPFSNRIIEFL